ncbi:endoglucanase [Sphingomonas sp. SORGH_AS802]|uniref:glycoside hydrolase family 5 protein n=1 Tax=Sphingomonas sp. SORGH_AS_0802 TaxID=3041800 RepID=UPI0028638CE7|nr:glycoside hydrolase family 5 protein [Sphingomonas sp. SORGH_AS_0802]MDR6136434.1 endoglucanase [Sphingomonas sp. SORGH_AS_0802]
MWLGKFLVGAALSMAGPALAQSPAMPAGASVSAGTAETGPAWATAKRLRRGVNIIGYDPLWRDPAKARFQPRHFRIIREGGFDFVRVVLQPFAHMDARNRLDPQWLKTLDGVVKGATDAGLGVILDEHDFNLCSEAPDACEPKLIAFWEQIGARYRGAPDTVLFELLNEPHAPLDGPRWNAMLARLIPVVRATNPERTLVIGPTRWNNLEELPGLNLPKADRNILVTFHSYEPFRFTHQGAPWAEDMKGLKNVPFTAADEARIRADYDKVAAWSKANDRPVLMGEFGAYEKSGTPVAARARYTATVRREAEAHGFPWAYWQFDSDFILYDIDRDRWVEPIRQALIPPAQRPTGQ